MQLSLKKKRLDYSKLMTWKIGLHCWERCKSLPPKGIGHWHYKHNKLVSYLPPGRTYSHLDTCGLFDTNKSPRGKEKVKSSWKLASGRQLRPVWHWSLDWLNEKFTDGSLIPGSGCKVNKVQWMLQIWPHRSPSCKMMLKEVVIVWRCRCGREWTMSCHIVHLNELLWFMSLYLLIEFIVALCLVGFAIFIYRPV